ncbi:hypothetical protein [Chryseobacterium polytrichastri]|uniref:Uncharacterized protein n=1 Tax=Chryseobacterium polytrichastri TaxID=1302687 RepID=A0A1M7BT34_9FLAO|nr:hypothetical protein [Chryseobacterium polytrichastri]SHL58185.1 hypothetical protein SAMN05444267_102082 [Chryseobacterium polytrichastri]
MITVHLTETEIQLYVDERQMISDEQKAHVEICTKCQAKTKNYALLFQSIHDAPKPTFDFDLSVLILEHLPQTQSETLVDKWMKYVVLGIIGIISLILLYLITPYLWAIFATISPLLICTIIVCTAGISMFLFTGMYHHYQQKIKVLNTTAPLQQ